MASIEIIDMIIFNVMIFENNEGALSFSRATSLIIRVSRPRFENTVKIEIIAKRNEKIPNFSGPRYLAIRAKKITSQNALITVAEKSHAVFFITLPDSFILII